MATFVTYLFLEHVEVVDDDTDEEIECEEGSADDEDDEVDVIINGSFPFGLLIHFSGVDRISHHFHPSFESGHLKQGQVSVSHMVERDGRVDPGVVLLETLELVINNVDGQSRSFLINAFVKLSSKELHAHDREDQPED